MLRRLTDEAARRRAPTWRVDVYLWTSGSYSNLPRTCGLPAVAACGVACGLAGRVWRGGGLGGGWMCWSSVAEGGVAGLDLVECRGPAFVCLSERRPCVHSACAHGVGGRMHRRRDPLCSHGMMRCVPAGLAYLAP